MNCTLRRPTPHCSAFPSSRLHLFGGGASSSSRFATLYAPPSLALPNCFFYEAPNHLSTSSRGLHNVCAFSACFSRMPIRHAFHVPRFGALFTYALCVCISRPRRASFQHHVQYIHHQTHDAAAFGSAKLFLARGTQTIFRPQVEATTTYEHSECLSRTT